MGPNRLKKLLLPLKPDAFAAAFALGRALLAVAALGCLLACATADPQAPDRTTARIVTIAPAAAEMLAALDLLERVVAVGEFGPWPAPIADLPVAGGYAEPNVEVVLSLGANVVITAKSAAASAAHEQLESLGVEVLALDTGTYEGVFAALTTLGARFDRAELASRVERDLREDLATIEAAAAGLERRKVLFVVGRDPLYVAGPGSHVDQMIVAAGGENVAADLLSSYQQMSVEAALERMPDVIVDTSDNGPDAARGAVAGHWSRWEFLPAVQNDRVYQVDPSQLVIPGMRLPQMTRLMAKLIHPETFGKADASDFAAYPPDVSAEPDVGAR